MSRIRGICSQEDLISFIVVKKLHGDMQAMAHPKIKASNTLPLPLSPCQKYLEAMPVLSYYGLSRSGQGKEAAVGLISEVLKPGIL